MAERNKLVIIGNGFDLAHGLKTSYNNFIDWYLRGILEKYTNHTYKDLLIEFTTEFEYKFILEKYKISDKKFCDWFIEIIQNKNPFKWDNGSNVRLFNINKISPFLFKLISNNIGYTWVNIEVEYYKSLIELYLKGGEYSNRFDGVLEEVKKLNSDFGFIKNQLDEYLCTIKCDAKHVVNQEINNLFQSDFSRGYHSDESNKQVHYLNFNYTNTIEKYIRNETNYQLNYIHGKLNTIDNPLIFGYGDEIDSYYQKIEHLNINEFLNNFKSFGYFKTENYEILLSFINSKPYDIEILGHSCGLSDRVLLNTIFEHDNCEKIKIHYYQKSEKENDFITKTQEISRHFKDKAKMRARIVDFTKCKPLVKYKPNK